VYHISKSESIKELTRTGGFRSDYSLKVNMETNAEWKTHLRADHTQRLKSFLYSSGNAVDVSGEMWYIYGAKYGRLPCVKN